MSQNTQQQVSPQDVKAPANQDTTQLTTPTTSSVGLDSLRSSYAAQQEAQIQTFLQSHGFESSTRIYQNNLTGSHVYRSTRNGADVVIKVSVPTVFQDALGSVKFSEDYAKGEETSLRKVAESSQRLYPGERLFPTLQGRISDGNELHGVVLEYIPGKNGQEYLESLKIEDRQMSTDQLVTFLRSGLVGVHCLQDAGLRHRDLNPRNIIIDETGEVKIIDLNFSKQLNQTAFTTIEPEGFYPPDAYGPQASGLSVDSYAIGMMALSLFTQQRPFDLVSAKGEVQVHDAKLDPALKNFLKKLCATNPKDRFADPQSAIRELDKIANKLARAGRVDKSSATEGVVAKVAEPQRQVSAVDVSTGAAPSVPVGLRLLALSNVKFLQEQALKSVHRNEGDTLGVLELLAGSWHTSIRHRVLEIASRYGDQATPVYLKLAGSGNAVLQNEVLEAVKSYDQPILPVLEVLAESRHEIIRDRVLEIANQYGDQATPVYVKLAGSRDAVFQMEVSYAARQNTKNSIPVLERLAESEHPDMLTEVSGVARSNYCSDRHGYMSLFAKLAKSGDQTVQLKLIDDLLWCKGHHTRDYQECLPALAQLAKSKHLAVLIATAKLARDIGSEEILARVFERYDRLFTGYRGAFVVGKMWVNGEPLDTLLSRRSRKYGLGYHHPQPVMLGYRFPTCDENIAYARSLLLKEADRSINRAELEALSIYRDFGVWHEDDGRGEGIKLNGNQINFARDPQHCRLLFVHTSNHKVGRAEFRSEAVRRLNEITREAERRDRHENIIKEEERRKRRSRRY